MHNPNSAIERIKNHLAYKLGQAMIDFASNGGGYCHLFKKLYEIKKQHKKEQKIYRQTIQVFPQLKYPNLETCSDYEQALRYKFHLSYMLGEVLIKAYQTWYKGGGFKLKNDIKKAKKEFQIFKEILPEIKKLNGKALKAIKDNQQLFLKEFLKIKNILKIHKNYQPILDNIFHNFHYFIQNFDLIEEWLLSNDFNERYKKENHPYPSLLDPKKLNDENEKINYKNIPAELAWDMNLPLPDKYKLAWLFKSCSGSMAMYNFFTQCEVGCQAYAWENGKKMYTDMKDYFVFFETSIAVVPTITQNYYNGRKLMMYKLLHLFLNIDTIMFIARDPFSIFKHAINHIDNAHVQYNIKSSMKNYKLSTNLFVFPKMHYTYSNSEKPNISSSFEKIFTNDEFYFTTQKRLNILKKYNKIENIECLEIADINKENAFNTFTRLAKKYGFTSPNDPIPFQGRVNRNQGDLIYLPVSLYAHPYDLTNFNIEDSTSICDLKDGVSIIITTHQIHPKKEGFVDITKEIFDNRKLMFDNIVLLVKSNEYEALKNNQELFLASKKYLNDYMDALEKHEQKIKDNLITEEQILDYLKDKKDLRIKLKSILDEDLTYVRENHPEYLQKWKYYQEFEKMCKELDR